jgi:hypothetical protein
LEIEDFVAAKQQAIPQRNFDVPVLIERMIDLAEALFAL